MFFLAWMPFMTADVGFWDKIPNSFWKPSQSLPPMIKVLIVHDEPGVVVEVKGNYKLYDPRTNEHISTRFLGKRKFMQPVQDGLRWGEDFPGLHQILIIPDDLSTSTVVDGVEYKGAMYVYDIGGSISIVNEINIEDYLKSILARQFAEPLYEETLAALAITARTNVYFQALNPKNAFWAVDGRKVGYLGIANMPKNTNIERSINATRFLVMSTSKGSEMAPFMGSWNDAKLEKTVDGQAVSSKISISEAEELAKKGNHAAQILNKAFPNTTINLMYSSSIK